SFEPTGSLADDRVMLSVNYSSGLPNNFDVVAPDGSRAQFSPVSGLTDEVYMATARRGAIQFTQGDMYTGTGVAGQIAKVDKFGVATIPWVTLPSSETG